MPRQLNIFGDLAVTPTVLREEERFGKWDARTGLTLHNYYSDRISGERLVAYQRGFREERALLVGFRGALLRRSVHV